ncbi:MAG: hypothetical protein Q9163_006505 [Psora crenata]
MAAVADQGVPSGTIMVADPEIAARAQEQWKENLNMHMICPDCKEVPPNLVEEFSSGDMVCGSCGLVLGDRIVDTRSEWRTFSNDDQGGDDPSRVGDAANPLLNGAQLQTGIASTGGSGGRNRDLQRAQNKATHDKLTKALMTAYKDIDAFCQSMSIPNKVSDQAKYLFKQVYEAGAFRGKSQETIIAGVIFIACRQLGVPRTFREIFALTRVSKGKFNQNVDLYSSVLSTDPKELCERFCNQLRLSFQITKVSQEIAEKMDKGGMLAGRSPLSIAAACIYTASHLMGESKTAKDISAVAGVSDGTIRNAYKLIYPKREKLINPEWVEKGKGGIFGDMKNLPTA